MAEISKGPHIGVLSSRFPSSLQPNPGLLVRERMFRVARRLPLYVVSPTPWVPLENWIRQNLNPAFRPSMPEYEEQQGIPVWFPRFMTVPGPDVLRRLDGWSMARGAYPRFAALCSAGRLDLIDAHGAYPDGYAGVLLGRRIGVPVTITLHGGGLAGMHDPRQVLKLRETFVGAARIFAVSETLRQFALELGASEDRVEVVGNGVDAERFRPRDRNAARAALGLSPDVPVLITSSPDRSFGERDYNRLIEALPVLSKRWPKLVCLFIGLDSQEKNRRAKLEALIARFDLKETVRFLDDPPRSELPGILSAADVFVSAAYQADPTAALLEAMACGLPVVAFDAGANRELVCRPELGELAPLGDPSALKTAIDLALSKKWDRMTIRRHCETFNWDGRTNRLCRAFTETVAEWRGG
ncbi:MAG: glycosyltransferase [Azoarcus sp.]|jgi:glycosyltransferase involved in cell wall biosynthesis|nr:glycosyltransferase [Azoarcus sp.]